MKHWKGIWYGQNPGEVQEVPKIVEADSMEEAKRKFYLMVNGNPPYPLLSLHEV